MDALLDSIRLALRDGASDQERAAGAQACQIVLNALGPKQAEQPSPTSAAVPAPPLASLVAGLRGMSIDQVLDLAIARLRSALPPDAKVSPVQPIRFQLVPLPHQRRNS